jgi:hypothetical protein
MLMMMSLDIKAQIIRYFIQIYLKRAWMGACSNLFKHETVITQLLMY